MDNQEILKKITEDLEIGKNSEIKQTEITNKIELNKEIKVYFIHQTAFLDYVYKFLYKLFLIILIFSGCFILINYGINYINNNKNNSNRNYNYQPNIESLLRF